MTTWIKPNGTEIELNDLPATQDQAKAYGWQKKSDVKAAKAAATREKNKAEHPQANP